MRKKIIYVTKKNECKHIVYILIRLTLYINIQPSINFSDVIFFQLILRVNFTEFKTSFSFTIRDMIINVSLARKLTNLPNIFLSHYVYKRKNLYRNKSRIHKLKLHHSVNEEIQLLIF